MYRRRFLSLSAASLALGAAAPGSRDPVRLSEAFLEAVRRGELAQVRTMLGQDPSLVYARDRAARSAYVLAHLHGRLDVARYLADQGFLMDAIEATLARNWERLDEVGAAMPGAFQVLHPVGGTAMHAAALGGLGRELWRVLRYGGDPDANPADGLGVTPVRLAVDYHDPLLALETVANLLGNGGDANAGQKGRDSVLHGAAAVGDPELIRLVIRKGGDPEARDDQGRTPERIAADLGHVDAASLLRQHAEIPRDHRTSRFAYSADGSDYEAPDLSGFDGSLRQRIVGSSHFDIDTVSDIAGRYADLSHSVSYSDEAAVEACAHTGQREIVEVHLDNGAPYSLPTAATMGDVEWCRRLLDEDPLRVHERGAHDFALMWYPALAGGSVDLARLFLDRGADIEQEHMGTTGLHFAVRGGLEDLTRFLLERGADPDRVGRKFVTSGETPLDMADAEESGRLRQILESAGASRRVGTGG